MKVFALQRCPLLFHGTVGNHIGSQKPKRTIHPCRTLLSVTGHQRIVRDVQQQRPTLTCASFSSGLGQTDSKVDVLAKELKTLEGERDEAIATGESCARTSVRLNDMVQLLQKLAMEKVQAGDEDGAKEVLKEKASVGEMQEKSNTRAKNNFALAAKLAEVIGHKQNELMQLVQGATSRTPPSDTYSAPSSNFYPEPPSFPSASQSQASSSSSRGYTPSMPKWQESLLEARERLQEAEGAGRVARLTAEESIAQARERLRSESESIEEAQWRLKRSTAESIAEAQERLRRQEAAALESLRRLSKRYRQGEYIPEDELDRAFRQLGKL